MILPDTRIRFYVTTDSWRPDFTLQEHGTNLIERLISAEKIHQQQLQQEKGVRLFSWPIPCSRQCAFPGKTPGHPRGLFLSLLTNPPLPPLPPTFTLPTSWSRRP